MGERFFSSKEAAEISGCSLRQLQYWREKGVVVPTVTATGTGRSVYYSHSELIELAVMEYLLSLGLSFETAQQALKQLKEREPTFADSNDGKRVMLVLDCSKGLLKFKDFERESAIASLDKGEAIVPLWLDRIYQRLNQRLKK